MTVRELIELLQKQDQDALVVVRKDSESNECSPLKDIWEGGYIAENSWSGEMFLLELTPEDRKAGYTEENVNKDAEKAVFLCPTN